jgi:hypothetical protein
VGARGGASRQRRRIGVPSWLVPLRVCLGHSSLLAINLYN